MPVSPSSNISSPEQLQQEYALRFAGMDDYRKAVWEILVQEFFQEKIGRDKTVLDLGAGYGEFINTVAAAKKYAMDLNPDTAGRIGSDVAFLQQDCSARWELEDAQLDSVFTSNFFEHLPTKDSLLETLKEAHRCLKPGGQILCLGPNIHYIGGAYWDFFDHHLALTHFSLEEALRLASFEMVTIIPRFLPYTMAHGRRPPLAFLRLYLKLPLVWRFVGKQFLLIARKPGVY